MSHQTSGYTERPHPAMEIEVPRFAKSLKRDILTAVLASIFFVVLDQTGVKFTHHLPTVILLSMFPWMGVRIYRFCHHTPLGKCPDCHGDLETIRLDAAAREVVCHRCHLKFLRYKPSKNADRIFEIDPDDSH